MEQLTVSNLILSSDIQPRTAMDMVVIQEYADEMKSGTKFPPIEVVFDGQGYWVWDGFHRAKAAKIAEILEILANVQNGTKQDAQWLALSANRAHGLRRTNADKKRTVELALEHPNAINKSLREIADHCGVSYQTIANYKNTIYQNLTDVITVTRNGSSYTMNTNRIGKPTDPDPFPIVTPTLFTINGYVDRVIDECDHHYLENRSEVSPFYQNQQVTVYNCDFRKVLPSINDGFFIFDPPYNIGFKYDIYSDNLPDEAYIEMLCEFKRFGKVVVIQYPEEMQRLVVPALGAPDHSSVWCYNSNTSRRFRLINWYGLAPDYSRIKQPYKNPTDRRVAQLIANGNAGTDLYEWWDDIQIVKNVSPEKTGHPCPIPEALIKRIITLGADPQDVIIDPFAGSLTTLKAAQDLGHRAIGMELSGAYIEEGIPRLSQFNYLTPSIVSAF